MLKFDLHVHTIKSGHAFNTLFEMAATAREKRIEMLGITDHGPNMDGGPHLGYFEMMDIVPSEIEGVKIVSGCEANVIDLDGNLDIPIELQKKMGLVLIGLHERTSFPTNTNVKANTQAIIRAMRQNRVHIVAHPWRQEFPVNIEEIWDAAMEHNVLLELNLSFLKRFSSTSKVPFEIYQILALARKNQRKMIISSDAHIATDLGDDSILNKFGLNIEPELVFNIEEVIEFLYKK